MPPAAGFHGRWTIAPVGLDHSGLTPAADLIWACPGIISGSPCASSYLRDTRLVDKLPPDQAAAYLKTRRAWSTVGETVQWLAAVALPVGVIAIPLTFRHRRQKLTHEPMRLMIEKGLPVPTE